MAPVCGAIGSARRLKTCPPYLTTTVRVKLLSAFMPPAHGWLYSRTRVVRALFDSLESPDLITTGTDGLATRLLRVFVFATYQLQDGVIAVLGQLPLKAGCHVGLQGNRQETADLNLDLFARVRCIEVELPGSLVPVAARGDPNGSTAEYPCRQEQDRGYDQSLLHLPASLSVLNYIGIRLNCVLHPLGRQSMAECSRIGRSKPRGMDGLSTSKEWVGIWGMFKRA